MREDPKVAVLILNYNGEDCLPRCLQSLEATEYKHYQVVVIDNGSVDRSLEIAKERYPEYIYLEKKENTGFAAGMNTGILYAEKHQFDFVWLLNYDAEVLPSTLGVLIEAVQKNPNLSAVSPLIKNPDGSIWFAGGQINFFRMRTEHLKSKKGESPYQTDFLTGCAPLFSIPLLREVGNFDERFFLYYEDADLSCRLKKRGEKLYVVPQSQITHAEKSQMNPKKLYFLVFSGLLFFAIHTPRILRFYIILYVTIRRLVNQVKLFFRFPGASLVAKAYADYFRKFQAGNQLYLRQLPERKLARAVSRESHSI